MLVLFQNIVYIYTTVISEVLRTKSAFYIQKKFLCYTLWCWIERMFHKTVIIVTWWT